MLNFVEKMVFLIIVGGATMKIEEIISVLTERGIKIATAESCTGGLLAKMITDVSGASNIFEMGLISYSNRIKNEFLEVPGKILDTVGAVSEETARQMAIGVTKLAKSDIGVGITGFAGPTGDSVGLVYISIYLKYEDRCIVKQLNLNGNRDEVRKQAADVAIEELYGLLNN